MKNRKATTDDYQIGGMSHGRILRGYVRTRVIRFGNFGDGVGTANMTKLALLHWLGYPLSYLSLRFEPHYIRLRRAIARLRGQDR